MMIRVVTAQQAAARDVAAIAAGTPSIELMRLAGSRSAKLVRSRLSERLDEGVVVFCGPGNNGGDGWVVARELSRHGIAVDVREIVPARTPDAIRVRDECRNAAGAAPWIERPGIVVDALLGTGASGMLRGAIGDAAREIARMRSGGAAIVALDAPTGIDATSGQGEPDAVRADLTVTFGSLKRGLLVARDHCGELVVLDIGLGAHADLSDGAGALIDARWVESHLPALPADAHKGTRRKLAVVGGAAGMAGAVALAARAAFRSGVGMVRVCVHPRSVVPLQSSVVQATALEWPDLRGGPLPDELVRWGDAMLIGPGLGAAQRPFVERLLEATPMLPTVLDADALNAFAGDLPGLARALGGRQAVLTPHAAEMARLMGDSVEQVLARRWEVGQEVAQATGAAVLLKGVPTVISSPQSRWLVSAAGSPVLAAAGSGDVLGGIVATVLAQVGNGAVAAACAAWAHGRAGELAAEGRALRGVTLDEVLRSLRDVWDFADHPPSPDSDGLLARLPRVPDR